MNDDELVLTRLGQIQPETRDSLLASLNLSEVDVNINNIGKLTSTNRNNPALLKTDVTTTASTRENHDNDSAFGQSIELMDAHFNVSGDHIELPEEILAHGISTGGFIGGPLDIKVDNFTCDNFYQGENETSSGADVAVSAFSPQ